jgi:hypothetical protein
MTTFEELLKKKESFLARIESGFDTLRVRANRNLQKLENLEIKHKEEFDAQKTQLTAELENLEKQLDEIKTKKDEIELNLTEAKGENQIWKENVNEILGNDAVGKDFSQKLELVQKLTSKLASDFEQETLKYNEEKAAKILAINLLLEEISLLEFEKQLLTRKQIHNLEDVNRDRAILFALTHPVKPQIDRYSYERVKTPAKPKIREFTNKTEFIKSCYS